MEWLFFGIGVLLGMVLGVVIMCMLQINRINRYEMEGKKDDEDEEKL